VLCHLKGVVALVKVLVDLVQCINGSIARLDEAAMRQEQAAAVSTRNSAQRHCVSVV